MATANDLLAEVIKIFDRELKKLEKLSSDNEDPIGLQSLPEMTKLLIGMAKLNADIDDPWVAAETMSSETSVEELMKVLVNTPTTKKKKNE